MIPAARTPNEPLVRFTQGSIALARGRSDDAIAGFEAALARNPQFAEAATNLGLALAKTGRVAEGALHFDFRCLEDESLFRENLSSLRLEAAP